MALVGYTLRSDGHNIAAPGANTNILTTGITPNRNGKMRVAVVLATTSVFNVTFTRGATTFTCGLNDSVALPSGDLKEFEFSVSTSDTVNFQVETDGIIRKLQVGEVIDGVQGA